MQPLDLNLASRPFKNDTLPWVGFSLAVVLVVAMTSWNLQEFLYSSSRRAELEEKIAGIEGRMSSLETRERNALRAIDDFDLASIKLQTGKANEVIRWKSFSWTRLFNQLQRIQPNDVQMSTINPVFSINTRRVEARELNDLERVPVSVEGTAKRLEDFLDLERALISDPHFDRVEPESTVIDDVTRETVFRLRFTYDPLAQLPAELQAEPEPGDAAAETVVAEASPRPAQELSEAAQAPQEDAVVAPSATVIQRPPRAAVADPGTARSSGLPPGIVSQPVVGQAPAAQPAAEAATGEAPATDPARTDVAPGTRPDPAGRSPRGRGATRSGSRARAQGLGADADGEKSDDGLSRIERPEAKPLEADDGEER